MLITLFAVSIVLQLFLFIPAFLVKTDKLTDFSYSLGFMVVASIAFSHSDADLYKTLLLSMIIFWSIRLGAYLVFRIAKTGKDKRFDEIRIDFWKFFKFWIFQGAVIPLILLPAVYFFNSSVTFSPLIVIGGSVWFLGIIIEGVSDIQKFVFKSSSSGNKNKWLETGLWRYSRHPNYLGEIMCWIGIYIFTFNALGQVEKVVGLLSPLTIVTLLVFVSGIPILEKKADERWGKDKKYQAYKNKTAKLIPFVY